MTHSRRRLTVACTSTVTVGLLAAATLLPAPAHAAGAVGIRRSDTTKPPPATSPAFGTFTDSGALGVRNIAGMQKWLGGTDLRVGHTYLPGDTWSGIEGQVDFLGDWARWRRARTDRMFVLNVPMLDRNESGVPDAQVRVELRQGALGQYDSHYKALARRLVALGVPDTVVVLGWEMNGITYTGRCGPDPTAWKAYWKSIVTTMRSVPGQRFTFDFAPNRGTDAIAWTRCYPGDDVVDILGMDSYDQPPGRTFAQQVTEPYGLRKHVEFAAAHGKPISYPEWGLFRNGDNPSYMASMLRWISTYKPLYNTLTDYCPHGVWQCSTNPGSSTVYRQALYGRGTQNPALPTGPAPLPTKPAKPPKPAGGKNCAGVNSGSWLSSFLDGGLCARFEWLKSLS